MTGLLTDQLRTMAARFPTEVGYKNVGDGKAITFAQWDEESNRLARGLIECGAGKGDRIAIYLPPEEVLAWLVAYAAIHKAGAVAVPTNNRLVPRELAYVLGHAEAVLVITSDQLLPTLEPARPSLPTVWAVVTTGTAAPAQPWDSVLADDASEIQIAVDETDLADIMYTSGTTGRPKGVAVRHGNVAMIPNNVPDFSGVGWLHASPLFTFAGIASVYNPMKLGLTGLYLPRFDAGRWLDIVRAERPGAAFLVPAMAQLILDHPGVEQADLSSLWMCAVGSAPIAPETIRRLQARMPNATITNGYGMTEAGPAYCAMPPDAAGRRIGSVGKPMPPVQFRIVDDNDEPLPAGEVGELLVRNPGREREYYRDPEATAEMWRGGWLHSGDLAYLDEDGYLYIVGRKKDVIIRGGINIHATDVESVLFEHPAVREAAVAGIPHPVLGEDVAAWVVLREGETADEPELRAFCAERMADFQVPRRFSFVSELPRNATGKVLKNDLVESL